jgi:transposase-like protein
LVESGRWTLVDLSILRCFDAVSLSAEFRREVLGLVEAGRPIKQIAELLGVSNQTIYTWRRQHLIDTGRAPGACR